MSGRGGRRTVAAATVATALLAAAAIAGCSGADDPSGTGVAPDAAPATVPPPIAMASRARALCEGEASASAPIVDPELNEISGLAVSPDQPGVLWVHGDSGAPPVVWALDPDGAPLARVAVTDARAVDWEDIAVGRLDGGPVLYLADIGDNFGRSRTQALVVYRVPEPDVAAGATATEPTVGIAVTYGDGSHDAEALLADPLTGDLVVVTKQWDGAPAELHRLPAAVATAADPPASPTVLDAVGEVAGTAGSLVTGGDVSADGTVVALRTYGEVLVWDRDPDASVAEALSRPPTCTRAIEEPQGEAVALGSDSRSLVTVSEGADVPLHWVRAGSG